MALPFHKNKQSSVAGLIIKMRKPDVDESKDSDTAADDSSGSAIHSCATELIRAVHAQDAKAVADALKDAFQILSQPQEAPSNESEQEPS